MTDSTVVLADLVSSTKSSLSSIDEVLDLVGQKPKAQYFNTWGDAFVAVFDGAENAVRYALTLRDELRMFDWGSIGHCCPPLLRTAIAVGPLGWRPSTLGDRTVPEGGAFVEAARIEPITGPGEVRVTDAVRKLAGGQEFFYEDIGRLKLPKGSGFVHLNRAYWSKEKAAVTQGCRGPLLDDQYYRRLEAMKRFALIWVLLDQLPAGSWGRSVALWMDQVWEGIPGFVRNPLIEDEGGFETTILNMELLSEVLGLRNSFEQ